MLWERNCDLESGQGDDERLPADSRVTTGGASDDCERCVRRLRASECPLTREDTREAGEVEKLMIVGLVWFSSKDESRRKVFAS